MRCSHQREITTNLIQGAQNALDQDYTQFQHWSPQLGAAIIAYQLAVLHESESESEI